jgi:FAD/FMN-containing dehydrogenase
MHMGNLVSNHTVVVHPETTEDVAKIVKIAVKHKMPITPYSGGTSLEGNFRAVRGFSINFFQLLNRSRFLLVASGWRYLHRFVRYGQDS